MSIYSSPSKEISKRISAKWTFRTPVKSESGKRKIKELSLESRNMNSQFSASPPKKPHMLITDLDRSFVKVFFC